MTTHEIRLQSEVEGVEIDLDYSHQPLIADGQGDAYFEPGFLTVLVTGEATVTPLPWYWCGRVVQLRAHESPQLDFADPADRYQIIPMPPGERLERILIRQQHVPVVGYGIWIIFFARSTDNDVVCTPDSGGIHGIAMRLVPLTRN